MVRFHKALPNVKRAYVTLQDFTPDLQKIYTDISAISVTLCNSGTKLKPVSPFLSPFTWILYFVFSILTDVCWIFTGPLFSLQHSVYYILCFIFCISKSVFYILYSKFCILNSVFYILYLKFCILCFLFWLWHMSNLSSDRQSFT